METIEIRVCCVCLKWASWSSTHIQMCARVRVCEFIRECVLDIYKYTCICIYKWMYSSLSLSRFLSLILLYLSLPHCVCVYVHQTTVIASHRSNLFTRTWLHPANLISSHKSNERTAGVCVARPYNIYPRIYGIIWWHLTNLISPHGWSVYSAPLKYPSVFDFILLI